MDVLSNAFADVDRMHAGALKAVNVAPMLTGNLPNFGMVGSRLAKAAEQYQHFRGWSFVAVKAIASKIAGHEISIGRLVQAPRAGRKTPGLVGTLPNCFKSVLDSVEPMESHPFLDALDNPNPVMVRWSLMFSAVASLMLTGRSYLWAVETRDGLQIWPIPAHWMEPGDPLRGTWKLRPFGGIETFELPARDVCPFIFPDPSNPFGAVSPLQSQALAVSTDEEIQNSQYRAFVNGIHPGLMIRVGRLPGMSGDQRPVLEPDQREQIIDAVLKLYGGSSNRQNPLIVDGLIEGVDKLTNSPVEMDFLDSGAQTKARILQAFGVNPVVAGEIENVNRASAAAASQNFCEQTINPLCELLSQSLTRFVAGRFAQPGEKLIAWVDCCRANDPEIRLREWSTARGFGDVTPNEFRAAVLNLPAIPGGDELRDQLGNVVGES